MEYPCRKQNVVGNHNNNEVEDQGQRLIIHYQRSINQMYQYQWRKWLCQDIRSADQPHVHHLCVRLVPHNSSVVRLPWFEQHVRAGFSPLVFFGRLPPRAKPLDDINHVSFTHVFLDVFNLNLLPSPSCIILNPFIAMPHASCFMLTPSLRSVPHCIAARSLCLVDFWSFLFLFFAMEKTLWISLFLHLLEGNIISPPPFSYPSYRYPSTIYPLPPAGSWAHLLPPLFTAAYLFIVSFIISTLPLKRFLFFSLPFLIRFPKKELFFCFFTSR